MGSVALVGLGHHGRRRGPRALGAAVLLLLLVDPWLAVSPGFALSALATAGILWFAPGWRDRLARWLPRWVAEAVSVPLAAQLACTPLVAAISGQVSPGRGGRQPARRAGRRAGHRARARGRSRRARSGPTWVGWVAAPAAWCASWIIAVAAQGCRPPGGRRRLVLRAGGRRRADRGLCVVVGLALGAVLARRTGTLALGAVMVVVLLVPMPTPGWPPRGWVMVACDVGQGDGSGAERRTRQCRRRGRRPRPCGDGPVPATARRAPGPAARADALPCRPRRRTRRGPARHERSTRSR